MLELLLTVAVFVAAAITLRGSQSQRAQTTTGGIGDPDLPCPWCHAATSERDMQCPNCSRAFGYTEPQHA